ncbi:glycosyltransferase [uncultured Gilvimarinus sp.]|uniref:glycosyltransferase n=1 Tax=uncultured Gilvimarinus sp. TaxID=1689143 RepID=UPI0030EC0B6F
MPAFNRADLITKSITTVLQQSYKNLELIVCDDGSTDRTAQVLASIYDPRVKVISQKNQGAAAARNACLTQAKGEFIAYLDTDNYWHPDFLAVAVKAFTDNPGLTCLYTNYVDYQVDVEGNATVLSTERPDFNHENLLNKPFIDLNTFVHRRQLYDALGGFDSTLSRRQDYDVILKYTWLRDPLHIKQCLALYQRNDSLEQITQKHGHDRRPVEVINRKIESYFDSGLPAVGAPVVKKVSVVVWDLCRNHFSKAFAVAEALSASYQVELIAFDFFDEGVFAPLKGVSPGFEVKYFAGGRFPDFFGKLRQAMDAVIGDMMYVVKPRLPSMGLAMLVNHERGIPYVIESNDLETVVSSPSKTSQPSGHGNLDLNIQDESLLLPYADAWSYLLDSYAKKQPQMVTHNHALSEHYGSTGMYLRNIKDERVYNPERYERAAVRAELGFAPDDRVILFGGLLRKHKGIYELVELLNRLNDPRYKLLFVGSRVSPDQTEFIAQHGDRVTVLPPQSREAMAKINYAADLVVLWLDPEIPASHYQFPYKATDAFAMETPVITNDISDLGELGRQGYVTLVPFADWGGIVTAIQQLFDDEPSRTRQVEAARRLFLRQFSYMSARTSFDLIARRTLAGAEKSAAVSAEFANDFNKFYQHVTGSGAKFTVC